MLNDADSGAGSLLARAGGNVNALKSALTDAVGRLPKVEGHGGEVQVGRDLSNLLNLTDKEAQKRGDQYIASELFLLAAAADKGEVGRMLNAQIRKLGKRTLTSDSKQPRQADR